MSNDGYTDYRKKLEAYLTECKAEKVEPSEKLWIKFCVMGTIK